MILRFRVFGFEDKLLTQIDLPGPIIRIGSLSTAHLRLREEGIARMHALIEVKPSDVGPDEVSVIDLTSAGTFLVNRLFPEGARIAKVRLSPGDSLRLGAHVRVEIEFLDGEAKQ